MGLVGGASHDVDDAGHASSVELLPVQMMLTSFVLAVTIVPAKPPLHFVGEVVVSEAGVHAAGVGIVRHGVGIPAFPGITPRQHLVRIRLAHDRERSVVSDPQGGHAWHGNFWGDIRFDVVDDPVATFVGEGCLHSSARVSTHVVVIEAVANLIFVEDLWKQGVHDFGAHGTTGARDALVDGLRLGRFFGSADTEVGGHLCRHAVVGHGDGHRGGHGIGITGSAGEEEGKDQDLHRGLRDGVDDTAKEYTQ